MSVHYTPTPPIKGFIDWEGSESGSAARIGFHRIEREGQTWDEACTTMAEPLLPGDRLKLFLINSSEPITGLLVPQPTSKNPEALAFEGEESFIGAHDFIKIARTNCRVDIERPAPQC